MPYARPTFSQIRAAVANDFATEAGFQPLRFSNLNALAEVVSSVHQDEYGYLDWIALQCVPFTATDEYLEGWAGLVGIVREAATYASGFAVMSGNPGAQIPDGSTFVIGNYTYLATVGGTIDGTGSISVAITATAPGSASNFSAGQKVSLQSGVSGITAAGVTTTPTNGADLETDDALRARMLQRYANPPQGGAISDYVTWALQVPGVTRAWAASLAGAGTVTVFTMWDTVESASSGIPQGTNGVSTYETRASPTAVGDQVAVADHIYPLRPVTALVFSNAPAGVPLNIALTEVPNDPTIQAAITIGLAALLIREATPGGVLLPDLTSGGTVRLSHIEAAIGAVSGLDHFVMTSPTADITVGTGQILIPGTITYS